jgi:Mce-associated membrane protein
MADLSTRKGATEDSASEDTAAAVTEPESDDTKPETPTEAETPAGESTPDTEAEAPATEAPTAEAEAPTADAEAPTADAEAPTADAEADTENTDADAENTDADAEKTGVVAAKDPEDTPADADTTDTKTEDDALATQVIKAPKARRGRPGKLVVILSVLLVALVAAGVALAVYGHRVSGADQDRTLALESAKSVATSLTTISAQNADAQINALDRQSTGAFRDQVSQYSAMFQAVLKQGQVGSTSEITAAGIEKLEGDTANALVTVSATITSAQVPNGQVRPYRLAIALQREGDHWLASNVDFVQ